MALETNAYVLLDNEGRIQHITTIKEHAEGCIPFSFPDFFDFKNMCDYRIVEGNIQYDPLPAPPPDPEQIAKEEYFTQLDNAISILLNSSNVSDDQIYSVAKFYNEWDKTAHYEKNDVVSYEEKLHRCCSTHDAQPSWNPTDAHSLWTEIMKPGEITEWRQTQPGIFDGYEKGQKVKYKGETWITNYDGLNVWEPGIYGWDKVDNI